MMLFGVLIQTPFRAWHEVWSVVAEDFKGKVPRPAQKRFSPWRIGCLPVGS